MSSTATTDVAPSWPAVLAARRPWASPPKTLLTPSRRTAIGPPPIDQQGRSRPGPTRPARRRQERWDRGSRAEGPNGPREAVGRDWPIVVASVGSRERCGAPASVSRSGGGRSGRRAIDFAAMHHDDVPPGGRGHHRRSGWPWPPVAGAAPTGTPPIVARRVRRPARGQPHREGLLVPARRPRPRARRDDPAPRHQRRSGDPRGDHRRRRRSRTAWEVAEAATVGAPPGPTPVVSVPPGGRRVADRRPLGRAGRRACGPCP